MNIWMIIYLMGVVLFLFTGGYVIGKNDDASMQTDVSLLSGFIFGIAWPVAAIMFIVWFLVHLKNEH